MVDEADAARVEIHQSRRCRFDDPCGASSSLGLPLSVIFLGRLVGGLSSRRRAEGMARSLIGVTAADGKAGSTN